MSRYNVSCCNSNLKGKRCGIQYVGQTKRELKEGFLEHFRNISKNNPDSEIARHFNSDQHKGLEDLQFHVVDFVYAAPHTNKAKYFRDLLEFNWIQRLHTNAPMGLNVLDLLKN